VSQLASFLGSRVVLAVLLQVAALQKYFEKAIWGKGSFVASDSQAVQYHADITA
jgi:hypothetical protein